MVVGLGILLIHKVRVVSAYEFHAIFSGKLNQHLVCLLLQGESLPVSPLVRVLHLMSLQLKIIIVAPHALMPLNGLSRALYIALENERGDFAGYTCRADDKPLMVFLQIGMVCTWAAIKAVDP